MESKARRKVVERYKTEDCCGVITNTETADIKKTQRIEVVNFNRKGVLLKDNGNKEKKGFLTLLKQAESEILIEKIPCKFFVTKNRADTVTKKEHQVALFEKEISPKEVTRLNRVAWITSKNNHQLWNLMLSDSKEVREEIYRIERCRSDIFLAVITAIFAAAVIVGCLFVKDNIQQGAFAVASVVSFLMFMLGAYTTLEKANALNERRGFLSNLNDYIQFGQMPISYQGWSKIKYFFRDCGVLMRLKRCPVKYPENVYSKHPPSFQQCQAIDRRSRHACRREGSNKAKELNLAQSFMPGMTNSFMSLCSYVYGILYGFSLLIFSYLIIYAINFCIKKWLLHIEIVNYKNLYLSYKPFLFLYAGIFISTLFLMKFRKWIIKESVVIITVLAATSIFTGLRIDDNNYLIFGCILSGLSGCLIGAIGGHLLNSLYVLRKGSKSPESYYFAWKKALEKCYAITDLNEPELKYVPDKRLDRWIIKIQRFIYEK